MQKYTSGFWQGGIIAEIMLFYCNAYFLEGEFNGQIIESWNSLG